MAKENTIKWKDTLNLPMSDFPMKAQLNQREPLILKQWEEQNIYQKILTARQENKIYILHDGPPYANGNIHLGTALNKILKDFVVKTKSMEGFYAPYTPGWDCHGLPIEIKVDKLLGQKKEAMDILDIRRKCKEYAEKYVDIQRKEFKRLGVFGDWNNPYKTIHSSYEASVIRYFKSFVERENVYRSKRPVFWCISCETALAEAEVEYGNHTSPSIYVKFRLLDIPDVLKPYQGKPIYVLIWTTTPWTIPANLAIALHADFDYALFEMKGEHYIAATRLVPVIADLVDAEYKIIVQCKGSDLNGVQTQHPLYDRKSLIINQDYVDLETGTGCVHTAPGHGEEDYRAGLECKLDIYSPVGPDGRFDHTTGKYEGKEVFLANEDIVADLNHAKALIHQMDVEHSYPHCWRCKNPVIFRATEQWFIAMDKGDLRSKALAEIKDVEWLPPWGEERIYNMIENRPDWCISRQRDWGVPIPIFYCNDCQEPLLSLEAIKRVETLFSERGSDAWYQEKVSNLLPQKTACAKCGSQKFHKGKDIIDVWFESGSSFSVLEEYKNHQFPADMYLEGGDQYRGWFHSSLLVAVSGKDVAPYKTVITHGWVLDHEGKAMSKSIGNVIEPQSIIQEKGAEILRLWVAMVNYREDVKLGDEILSRITESYRKIRNTWKFMLGVLADFDPAKDSVADQDLREIDLYILARLQEVKTKIFQAYTDYEYHTIYHTIFNFFTTDLSAFYLHLMKDPLYCNKKESSKRRAAQTTIFKLLQETLLLTAPILSFTSEEAWQHLPHFPGKQESIHLHLFPKIEKKYLQQIDLTKWEQLLAVKDKIFKHIEDARAEQKIIGDTLEAEISLNLTENTVGLLAENLDLFKEIMGVAHIHISRADSEKIEVTKVDGFKCPRCWNWFKEKQGDLCPRCQEVIEEMKLDY